MLLCLGYASNSVDKILTGHAYIRAVRGHLLVQTVLARIILDKDNILEKKREVISSLSNMENLTVQRVEEMFDWHQF